MQGGISREFTVWCGKCIEWFQVSARTEALAIKEFKQARWVKINGIWLCPTCGNTTPQQRKG